MNDGHDSDREDELFAAANRWFFRLQAEDVTDDEKQGFSAWLKEDPAHVRAWQSVHALMDSLQASAKASYRSGYGRRPHRLARQSVQLQPRTEGKRYRWVATACCLLFIAGFGAYIQGAVLIDRCQADYLTTPGERRAVTLTDGTRIDLDTDTAIKTNITGSERRVTVLRGTAFFQIARDARPFVVGTRDGESRDIGTSFSVEKQDSISTVTVAEGIVDVKAVSASKTTVRVTAGEAVDYGASGLSPLRDADLERDLAWRRGQIIFRQERLTDVVAKLNRYRSGRIVIVNPWIGGELVSGTFNIDNPDAPIDALEAVLGIRATAVSPYLVALR